MIYASRDAGVCIPENPAVSTDIWLSVSVGDNGHQALSLSWGPGGSRSWGGWGKTGGIFYLNSL